ncbi:MAG: hypothetical protein GY855_12105 [candidate division Zixibacteria bacterium]|nr:hypothetical protein [candidate division Zixibacteria bacterium]
MLNITRYQNIVVMMLILLAAQFNIANADFRQSAKYLWSVTLMSELVDSLNSPIEAIRIVSTLRITELNNPSGVQVLINAFEKEPSETQIIEDDIWGVKYYALLGIGEIGGGEAKEYLQKVVDDILNPHDNIFEIGSIEFKDICLASFKGLADIGGEDVEVLFKQVFEDREYSNYVRRQAFKAYQRVYLNNPQFSTYRDSMFYLMDSYKSIKAEKHTIAPNVFTDEYIMKSTFNFLQMEYGAQDPDVFYEYRNQLNPNDPFHDEIDNKRIGAKSIIRQKERTDRQFGKTD